MSSTQAATVNVGKGTLNLVRRAIRAHGLLSPGDRVAVGISGGKDSLMLYCALRALRQEFDVELQAVHLDQHQPGYDKETFQRSLSALDIPCEIVSEDTWSVVSSSLKPTRSPRCVVVCAAAS